MTADVDAETVLAVAVKATDAAIDQDAVAKAIVVLTDQASAVTEIDARIDQANVATGTAAPTAINVEIAAASAPIETNVVIAGNEQIAISVATLRSETTVRVVHRAGRQA